MSQEPVVPSHWAVTTPAQDTSQIGAGLVNTPKHINKRGVKVGGAAVIRPSRRYAAKVGNRERWVRKDIHILTDIPDLIGF